MASTPLDHLATFSRTFSGATFQLFVREIQSILLRFGSPSSLCVYSHKAKPLCVCTHKASFGEEEEEGCRGEEGEECTPEIFSACMRDWKIVLLGS